MKNIVLTIGLIMSVIYALFVFINIPGAMGPTAFLHGGKGAIILPHVIVIFVGMILYLVGYFSGKTGFVLTAVILYTVGFFLLPEWALLSIPGTIISWVGFAFMIKASRKLKAEQV